MTAREFRITVRGRLSEQIGARFDGMRLEYGHGSTILVGPVVDASQLYGVIDHLRDLGLELMAVEEAGP